MAGRLFGEGEQSMVPKKRVVTKRFLEPAEFKPKGPKTPSKLVRAAMVAVPAALRQIRKSYENTTEALLRQLEKMGHISDAGNRALYCHLKDGRIAIEEHSTPHKDAVSGSEWVERSLVVWAKPALWNWWREAVDKGTPQAVQPVEQSPRPVVKLRGMDKEPLVFGKPVDRLSTPVYKLIGKMIEAGPVGMSKDQLEQVNGDARKHLRGLRKKRLWAKAIVMAKKAWKGYAILHE